MRKTWMALVAALCLAWVIMPALASGTLMNVYIPKETRSEQQAAEAAIGSKKGELLVTRQSVYTWDEEGESRWAMFVELENTSQERIVIDETWLYTCRADRETTATWHFPAIDGAFYRTATRFYPGERVILYAGSVPVYEQVYDREGVRVGEQVYSEGLDKIANRMKSAKLLRVRLGTRVGDWTGTGDNMDQIRVPVEADVCVKDGKLCMEMIGGSDGPVNYYALGAVMSDAQGRIVDVLRTRMTTTVAPGERVILEKDMLPYVTAQMLEGATFEPFAYVYAKDLAKQ